MTLDVLACEPAFAAATLDAALALRRAGKHYVLAVRIEDARVARVREYVRDLCATYATWDEVRLMFDGFGLTIAEMRTSVTTDQRAKLIEAMRMADAVAVRSWSEYAC